MTTFSVTQTPNQITTSNIAYAPISHIIIERNKMVQCKSTSISEVLEGVIQDRIDDLETKLNILETLKERHIQNENFEMLGIVRKESEYLQMQITQFKLMADIYHVFDAIRLQLMIEEY